MLVALLHLIVTTSNVPQFSPSVVFDSLQPHGLQHASFPVHHQLPELAQTYVHRIGDAIKPSHLCCPLILLPPILPSIRVFSNESVLCIRWPNYWSFSFSIRPSNEYSGLISFMIDWFGLFAVQGTLKNLLQHCSSKTSILQCSTFLYVKHLVKNPLANAGDFKRPRLDP